MTRWSRPWRCSRISRTRASLIGDDVSPRYRFGVANRALLFGATYAASPTEYEPDDAWLGANYSVPILWLSLFQTSDLVKWPGTIDSSTEYTALLGARETCMTLSRKRLDVWRRRWPNDFAELGEQWLDFVSAVDTAFVGVWTEDLSGMTGDEVWASLLISCLHGLDDPQSPDFGDAFGQSYVTIDPDTLRLIPADGAAFPLVAAGYSWARRAPWEPPA